jgi:hypothetical protein
MNRPNHRKYWTGAAFVAATAVWRATNGPNPLRIGDRLHIRIGICPDSQLQGPGLEFAHLELGAPDRRLKPIEAG